MKKIRVGAVSYLNTKPLLYGIHRHPVKEQVELVVDYPSQIARMLLNNELDAGLIPVAAIPLLNEWHIISDYCIGADGPVASVCIFSEVPMEEITTVLLDYQSRTSVQLARILLKEFWKKDVELVNTHGEDFRQAIKGTTAGVVIGDRALEQRHISPYIYDLAEGWKQHTGLPFVFAAWVSNKQLPAGFIHAFNQANALGLENLPAVAREINFAGFDMEAYYIEHISYVLDKEKVRGMDLYLEKLSHLKSSLQAKP